MKRLLLLAICLALAACANQDQRRADYHPVYFMYTGQ